MCFTYYVVYVATFHCRNAILDQWGGGGEKHLKLNRKTCFNFPMSHVTYLSIFRTHAQKEDITLFDSKSTSIHSLIIQHVYTLKNSTAFMVETTPGLRMIH